MYAIPTEHRGYTLPVHMGPSNPKTPIQIQKRHPYTGNLKLETSGDSKNAFYIVEVF